MSTNVLPIQVTTTAISPFFKGNPQEFAEAIAAGLQLVSSQSFALFVAGSTEPAYDTGPWAKNGRQWWFFDTTTGRYAPFTIPQESLRYVISAAEPSASTYDVWFQIDNSGNPLAVKVYFNGAWTSFYYLKSEVYTKAEMNALFSGVVSGKMQVDWAQVINRPTDAFLVIYPARVRPSASQSVTANGVSVKVLLQTEVHDPQNVFDTVLSRYVVPVQGYYEFTGYFQVENDTADASGMQITMFLNKNGTTSIAESTVAVATPPGLRWFNTLPGVQVYLSAGDFVELWITVIDGVGTGAVNVTNNAYFCGKLLQKT